MIHRNLSETALAIIELCHVASNGGAGSAPSFQIGFRVDKKLINSSNPTMKAGKFTHLLELNCQ